MKNHTLRLSVLKILAISFSGCFQKMEEDSQTSHSTEWVMADLLREKSTDVQILGNPELVESPYGEVVQFNGFSDALFLEAMPLQSVEAFTVEMIFFPETDSPFEQRIVHIGEVDGDRMLLEIRVVDGNWYFDGFVASKGNGMALIDEKLTHPLEQWHHVALVVSNDSLTFMVYETEYGATVQCTAIGQGMMDFKYYTNFLAENCPGVPIHVETVGSDKRSIPFLKPEFWDGFPDLPASGIVDFLNRIKHGQPVEIPEPPVGEDKGKFDAEQKYLMLRQSLDYLRRECGAGLKS